ncbi:protein of unknown function [Legionella fallonii LLAP-10]|uniref:Uncharacterized protein n=1 Tax=Legionella fallonii LLAP-10 TaxID=1212491 RepID=A0A098G420_9GAMM|nr:protein of unknown function [Legionella fallonii LLAP-10]
MLLGHKNPANSQDRVDKDCMPKGFRKPSKRMDGFMRVCGSLLADKPC